jgi:hypothetical protein
MMGCHAKGKDFPHNPLLDSPAFEASPDCLRPSRGVVDHPTPRFLLLGILVKRHATQVPLKITGILANIVQQPYCGPCCPKPNSFAHPSCCLRDGKQVVSERLALAITLQVGEEDRALFYCKVVHFPCRST